jgi:hypothetical protein
MRSQGEPASQSADTQLRLSLRGGARGVWHEDGDAVVGSGQAGDTFGRAAGEVSGQPAVAWPWAIGAAQRQERNGRPIRNTSDLAALASRNRDAGSGVRGTRIGGSRAGYCRALRLTPL